MVAANKTFRRVLIGSVSAVSLFAACGAVAGSVKAMHPVAVKFPVEPDRADLSLGAALWRSEFLGADTKKHPEEAAESSATRRHADRSDEVFSGLAAAEDFYENETLFSSDSAAIDHSADHSSTQSMNDWQNAVCNADGSQGKHITAQGPSAVTAVVAVVGAVVVFGAYFKSSNR